VTTYAKREITTRRVEYGVESGQLVGEFHTVYGIARADFERRTDRTPDDGWARIESRDDEITIVFDVEYEARNVDREVERLTAVVGKQDAQIRAVLDLVDRADRDGWEAVLHESGHDIPQAIRRILKP
jgi:hypothetical protein